MKIPTPGELAKTLYPIDNSAATDWEADADYDQTMERRGCAYAAAAVAYAAIAKALREEAKLQAHTFYNGALVIVANAIDAALSSNPAAKEKS